MTPEYTMKVLDKLEYINYPDIVMGYEPESVTKAIHCTIMACYESDLSSTMCACLIYGMTWTIQIVPSTKEMVRH